MNMVFRSGLEERRQSEPPSERPVHAVFREFMRAMADQIDEQLPPSDRDTLLCVSGERMARLLPLPAVESVETLGIEINDRLADIGWGSSEISLVADGSCLLILHRGMPRIGAAGDPPGTWMLPVLEGLYQEWLANQPGGDVGLQVRKEQPPAEGIVFLSCGRQ